MIITSHDYHSLSHSCISPVKTSGHLFSSHPEYNHVISHRRRISRFQRILKPSARLATRTEPRKNCDRDGLVGSYFVYFRTTGFSFGWNPTVCKVRSRISLGLPQPTTIILCQRAKSLHSSRKKQRWRSYSYATGSAELEGWKLTSSIPISHPFSYKLTSS